MHHGRAAAASFDSLEAMGEKSLRPTLMNKTHFPHKQTNAPLSEQYFYTIATSANLV